MLRESLCLKGNCISNLYCRKDSFCNTCHASQHEIIIIGWAGGWYIPAGFTWKSKSCWLTDGPLKGTRGATRVIFVVGLVGFFISTVAMVTEVYWGSITDTSVRDETISCVKEGKPTLSADKMLTWNLTQTCHWYYPLDSQWRGFAVALDDLTLPG